MKKIFYVIVAAVLVTSCLGNTPSTKRQYTLDVDFEYADHIFLSDSVRFDNDSGRKYIRLSFRPRKGHT